MKSKKDFFFLIPISIFLILALIRFLHPLNFWVDEMFHVFAAKNLLETGLPTLPSGYLYDRSLPATLLIAASFKFFGVSEFSARLPFLAVGVFSMLATYFLVKNIFGQDTAILSVFLLSLSPWQVYWALNARMYVLLQFLYILFLIAVYGFSRELDLKLSNNAYSKKKAAIFSLILLILVFLSSYVHEFYIIFFAVWFTYFAFLIFRKLTGENKLFGKEIHLFRLNPPGSSNAPSRLNHLNPTGLSNVLSRLNPCVHSNSLLCFILLLSLFLILIRLFLHNMPFAPGIVPEGMQLGMGFYVLLLARYFTAFSAFALFSFAGLMKAGNWENQGPLVFLGFFVPFILLTLFLDAKNSRYLFFAFPLFVALAANGMFEAREYVNTGRHKKAAKYLTVFLFTVLLVRAGAGIYKVTSDSYQPVPYEDPHPHWNYASAYVKHNMQNGDVVLSTMPICTLYYLEKTDYWLRQNEYYSFEDETGVSRDLYTGAVILKDYQTFRDEIEGKSGWLIADRKLDSYFTDPKVLEYVHNNMTLVREGSDETIKIYRFEGIGENKMVQ